MDDGDGSFHANLERSIIHCPQKAVVDLPFPIPIPYNDGSVPRIQPLDMFKAYYSQEGIERRRNASTQDWGKEECLIVTVSTPRLQKPDQSVKLPVLFFVHGVM